MADDWDEGTWKEIMDVNFTGPVSLAEQMAPVLAEGAQPVCGFAQAEAADAASAWLASIRQLLPLLTLAKCCGMDWWPGRCKV